MTKLTSFPPLVALQNFLGVQTALLGGHCSLTAPRYRSTSNQFGMGKTIKNKTFQLSNSALSAEVKKIEKVKFV